MYILAFNTTEHRTDYEKDRSSVIVLLDDDVCNGPDCIG